MSHSVCLMAEIELRRFCVPIVVLLVYLAQTRICGVRQSFGDAEAFSAGNWRGTQRDCGVAHWQGRRPSQEDRVICMPELILPGLGKHPDQGFLVSLFGVFDGHNGAEASEMASTYLPQWLHYHTWSIISLETNYGLNIAASADWQHNGHHSIGSSTIKRLGNQVQEYQGVTKDLFEKELRTSHEWNSMYRLILKEALFRALADIDSAFLNEARKKDWQSGSTAVVVLKADRYLLVANIGDSKAFVCSPWANISDSTTYSSNVQEIQNVGITMELTIDHRPDRLDEKARIEAAGGFVSTWGGVPRVNGQLAISRAIGDVSLKKYGVTAEPEFTDWQEIPLNGSFLFLASDGIFEMMETRDVCNMLQDKHKKSYELLISESKSFDANLHMQGLAEAVVVSAFERGSMDNLAVVLYPLSSWSGQQFASYCADDCKGNGAEHDVLAQNSIHLMQSGFKIGNCKDADLRMGLPFKSKQNIGSQDTGLISVSTTSPGLLLIGREEGFCYEIAERIPRGIILPLQTSIDLASGDPTGNVTGIEGLAGLIALPCSQKSGPDVQVEVYHEHLVCLLQPVLTNKDEFCLNPESFANYLRLIAAVPLVENNSSKMSSWEKVDGMDPLSFHSYIMIHHRYELTKNVGRGGFGEVWFAVLKNCSTEENMGEEYSQQAPAGSLDVWNLSPSLERNPSATLFKPGMRTIRDQQKELYVLKRILVEKGDAVYLSGIRERYFGEIFRSVRNFVKNKFSEKTKKKLHAEDGLDEEEQGIEDGLKHLVRYVESFQANMHGDLWLVFCNEGYPLSSLLYTVDRTIPSGEESSWRGHIRVMEPSNWWRWLKTTEDGQQEMRSLIYQLLLGVKACHDRNITHRDIKPENMMVRARSVCSVTGEDGQLHIDWPCNLSMRIIDFGSAIDTYSLLNLYGPDGPSRSEQTAEYTPPESFLQKNWIKFHGSHATMYDMWSIGVVILELVLGTPHVFQISSRTRALLDQSLEGWERPALDTAYKLRALLEMCILLPGHSKHHQHVMNLDSSNLASWKCTEENIMQLIKEHDPLGIGLTDVWALRLLRELLQWHPEARISAEEALRHPYFHPTLQDTGVFPGKDDKK